MNIPHAVPRMPVLAGVATLLPIVAPLAQEAPPGASPVQFQAADGVTVFGDLYRADRPLDAPIILLFHQGGSDSRSEYGTIAPRLTDAGYHALAIDQRSGGNRLGGTNRTVAALGREVDRFCDAMPDLEAALAFVAERGFTGPRVAWGSSYSAALVFHLAAAHPRAFAAVLAFSPASGDPMAGCSPETVSASLDIPVLALRPAPEMEMARVQSQLEMFQEQGHETYVADPGVHGSSMLNAERVGASTDATWEVVLDFLRRALDR